MAYAGVTLPLTGTGDATAAPAVDVVGGLAFQAMKLVDGLEGSTDPVRAIGTTPGATDHGMVTRPIGSTAHPQAVVGEVALTSVGSTRTVGVVTVGNPTTSVNVANPTTAVNVANPTTSVTVTNPSTAVTVSNPTTAVSLSSQHTVTVGNPTTAVTVSNPTTAVTVSSGVVLGAGSTANTIGAVQQGAPAASSDNAWWVRTVSTGSAGAGSTTVDLGSGGSTKMIGIVTGTPFSSGSLTRSTLNSSAEGQLFAANAARDYVMITNMATAVTLFVGLTTGAVSTAGANAHFVIPPLQTYTLGGQLGNGPKYTGPIRCRINSTTIAGPVIGVEFST